MSWTILARMRPASRAIGRPAVAVCTLVLMLASALGVAGAGALQELGNDAPPPATGHAEVVAQGVAPMPAGEVAWRVTRASAPRPMERPENRALGFVLAEEDALQLVDLDTQAQTRLAAGEAAFVAEGAAQAGFALGDGPVAYYRIDLVPADQVEDDLGDEAVFAGEIFAAPDGNRDLDLVRDVLAADEETELALGSAAAPAVLLVTDGEVELVPASDSDAESVRLGAGQAAGVAGEVIVRATDDGATFVAAVVGPAVPPVPTQPGPPTQPTPAATPEATAGSIAVTNYLCPPGYEGKIDTDVCAEPGAGIEFTVALYATEFSLTEQTDAAGEVGFGDLGPGEYLILSSIPGDFVDRISVNCFAKSAPGVPEPRQVSFTRIEPNGVGVQLGIGDEVYCTWFTIPSDAQGTVATIALTVQLCPTAETPTEQCAHYTEPGVAATFTGPVFLSTDVGSDVPVRIHGVNWVWGEEGGIPLGVYYLDPSGIGVPPGYAIDRVEGSVGGSDIGWAVAVSEATPNAYVNVVYVEQSGGGEEDADSDGATAAQEAQYGTDPNDPDSDDDGASDGQEINYGEPGPSPTVPDSDGDGLLDGVEMNETGTNPAGGDSDNDQISDGDEVNAGTDPLDPDDPPGGDGQ